MDKADTPVTSISAGALVRPFLLENDYLRQTVRGIFPCIAPEGAQFPYIEYSCTGSTTTAVKPRAGALDRITVEFTIYAVDYDEATRIAEEVRETICEYTPATTLPGLTFNGATMATHYDGWAGDCYFQRLTLNITLIGTN